MKQLRSVSETEFSVDNVFDNYFKGGFDGRALDAERVAKLHSHSKSMKKAFTLQVAPFTCLEKDTLTRLQYRKIPLPW